MKQRKISKTNVVNFSTYLGMVIFFLVMTALSKAGVLNRSMTGLLVPICCYMSMAVSLNLTVGILGELSLGHAGFMSVGAFAGVIASQSLLDVVPSAGLRLTIAMIVGALFATIAGFIDGILDGTIPQEKREYYLKIVSDEVKRLSRLVKSMLDLSRIDSGALKLNPVRFDLTEVTCSVLVSFERRLEEKNITVTGLENCGRADVNGDYDLIGQVVYNLLDNAIKFINPGGVLTIRTEKREGRVYCSVRNTGLGISAQEMPRIFERFYKSDKSRSLDKNGVGLGLYIVKSVINLHHGEIYVRSVEGEYCEFTFWLPDADLPLPGGRSHEKEKNKQDKNEKSDKSA